MIDAPDLLNFLQNEQSRAVDVELNGERATALSFYRGDPFGDEVDGRSKLRTRDVAEVVDYMCVSVMRTLDSSDRIVEFEATRPLMVEQQQEGGQPTQRDVGPDLAQEATDRIHWNFMREQDGFRILYDGIKSGLLEKSGVWKTWVEIPQVPNVELLNSAVIDARDDVVDAVEVEGLFDIDPETGEPLQVYEATVMVDGEPIFKDRAVANEEFFVSPDARDLETAAYVGDTSRQPLSALADMGYGWDVLEGLWGDNDASAQQLADTRDEGRSYKDSDDSRRDYNRVVTLREEYCRWFWDGRYQLVRIHRVGNTILGVEPALMIPYVLWSPFPMPHRLIGQSLADKVLDIQVVRSHMLRQAMDALYLANAPRVTVDIRNASPETIDDLLDVAPGGIIRYNGQPPMPLTMPFVGGNAFQAMEIMAGEKESRTGITRMNQGLDADAINKTATGTALMQASGQQIEESIARQVANAVGELFEKKLRLMIELMQPHEFRIDGEIREIVPQDWPEDMRLAVRVGLGTGNRDKRLQGIMLLQQAMQAADQANLVGPEQVFNACKLLVSNLGFGTATQFFLDPATMPDQPQQPDPEMAKVEAEAQREQQKLQGEQAAQAFRLQSMRDEMELKQQLAREQAEFEAELAVEKMQREFELARERIRLEASLKEETFMSKNRPGGDLDK